MILDGTRIVSVSYRTKVVMVCLSGNDYDLASTLILMLDEALRAIRREVAFWLYTALPSGVMLDTELKRRCQASDLGVMLVSNPFLASRNCLEELQYWEGRHAVALYKLSPVDNTNPTSPIYGRVLLPFGGYEGVSWVDCIDARSKADFVQLLVPDLTTHLSSLEVTNA